ELRTGNKRIGMVTVGQLECEERQYETPVNLYNDMNRTNIELEECVHHVLEYVHHQFGRDSASIISWDVENKRNTTYPSDQSEKIQT
ncbi:protein phosphatase 2C domain-containing protein, partial [Bacillus cereus group sp. Bce026]